MMVVSLCPGMKKSTQLIGQLIGLSFMMVNGQKVSLLLLEDNILLIGLTFNQFIILVEIHYPHIG